MKSWRNEHKKTINDFLFFLNQITEDYILKGGTALITCYNLDRFSEYIDLDGKSKNIGNIVAKFCENNKYTYRTAKDTDTVKRYMVNYGNSSRPLKVEISFRKKHISKDEYTKINGICVYKIDNLCLMKTNAYLGRDKIRDLYDVSFICNNYYNQLSQPVISNLQNALEYKGLEQFDYIINQQKDELIDNEKLTMDFLTMFEKLNLMYTEKEKESLQKEEPKKNKTTDISL